MQAGRAGGRAGGWALLNAGGRARVGRRAGRRAGGRARFCSDSRARARARGHAPRGRGGVSLVGGRVDGLAHLAAEPKSARAHLNAGRWGGWAGAFERGRAGI